MTVRFTQAVSEFGIDNMTMKTMERARGILALWVLSGAVVPGAVAHHSFAAEYDINSPVTLMGTVTRVAWTNPHAFFYIDVEDEQGNVANWELELGSPNMLIRYRFTRDTLPLGESVTVEGFLARDGSNLANARTIRLADGRVLTAGSSANLGDTR